MGDCVESLAEVKVDNIHSSPFVYPASHVIVESYQIGQAWFPLGESMLTTPDNLLFFNLLHDGLQDKLLHHLSRDGGVCIQVLLTLICSLNFKGRSVLVNRTSQSLISILYSAPWRDWRHNTWWQPFPMDSTGPYFVSSVLQCSPVLS